MLALIAVIITAILLLPSCGSRGGKAEADTESTTLVKAGDKAPDFTVEMFDGTKTSLAELKGKVVLLNFWGHLVPALPAGTDPRAEGHHRPFRRPQLRIPAHIARRKAERRGGVPRKDGLYVPDGPRPLAGHLRPLCLELYPAEFLIGADGKVVLATVGYDAEEFDEMIKTIEKILE